VYRSHLLKVNYNEQANKIKILNSTHFHSVCLNKTFFFSFSYISDVCGKNYLAVGSKRRENLCGTSTPHVFISDENHMWITYYQNTSVANVGFEAKYTLGKI